MWEMFKSIKTQAVITKTESDNERDKFCPITVTTFLYAFHYEM